MGLSLADRGGVVAAPGLDQVLVDAMTLGGHEPLMGVPCPERSAGQANLFHLLHCRRYGHEQIDLGGERNVER